MIKGEPIHILLVDDDPAHSEAVRRALKASGLNVVIQPAGTLKKYREIAAAHQPDIAILDLSLPDGRAVEVLISPPEAGPFPIVVITSQGDELLAVEAMKAGALDYIVKSPEAFAGMPRTVERVLHEWGMLQERKRAEEALQKSEEKYRTLFDNANEAIFVVQGGKLVFCNPMTIRLMGYSSEEIRTKPFTEFVYPDDRDMVVERHLKRLRGEEAPALYSLRLVDHAGNTRWAEINAVLINWEGKAATLNFANDITERKRAEEALRGAEENFRCTLDDSPLGVCIVTAEGETIYANRAILDIYGYDSLEELRTTPVKNRYTPESYAEFQIRHNKRQQGEEAPSEYEISIVKKNGEVRHLQVFRKEVLWNGERQYQALYRDTTERKRGEEALRESEEKYRTLFDNAGEAIFVAQGGKLVFSNPMTARLLGYPSEEIGTKPFTEFIHPHDRNMVAERHLKRLRGEELPAVYSFRILNGDGNTLWVDIRGVLINWEGQAATLNFVSDITERKQAEEALRESEEKHRMLFETMAQGVVYQDADGRIISANPAAERILGLSLDQIRGRTSIDPRWRAIHEDGSDYPGETHPSMIALRTGREVQGIMAVFNPQKESHTWISISAVPQFRPGESQPYQVYTTFTDITERKRAEEVIRASLREKEVLLREIHHRVKNNMQVISSLFNLQAGYIKDEEALRILKEGQTRIRSMALVHEKLYQSGDLSKIDLAGYIQSLSAHLFHVYLVDPNQVRLETEFEDVPVDINTAVPCGLILNELISNALKHAFPAGRKGVLTIRLRRGKDGAVELRIADNGVGFPKGLDFRRTDSLGLQIVSLLVGQLEGTIKLAVKNGTAFTVAFREMKQELGIGADRGHK